MTKPLIVKTELDGRAFESVVRPLSTLTAAKTQNNDLLALTLGDDFGPVVYVALNKKEVEALSESLKQASGEMNDFPKLD